MLLIGLILFSCGTALQKERAPESRYRVGDFVIYRYSGSYLTIPVILTEKVIDKSENQLTIEVHWKSGDQKRTWKQVVTDTPENQKSNRVDRLLELRDGKEISLENRDNADLYRLFQGTYVVLDEPIRDAMTQASEMIVCGNQVRVVTRSGTQVVSGKKYHVDEYESSDFLWNHLGASYVGTDGTYYKAEVIDCNRVR